MVVTLLHIAVFLAIAGYSGWAIGVLVVADIAHEVARGCTREANPPS